MPWSPKKTAPNTLRLAFGSDPLVVDPQLAETGLAVYLAQQLTSTLFIVGKDLKINNRDAESYAWENEGKKLSIQLRKDLTWSDASPLNTCQYKDAILRALDPKIPSPYADLFHDIKGAAAFKSGKSGATEVGITCDPSTQKLEFDVLLPFSSKTLYALAFVVSAPIRKEFYSPNNLGENHLISKNLRLGVSNGSYTLQEWKRDQKIILKKNPLASNDNLAQIDVVEIPIIRDVNTAFTMFESGDLDILDELPPSQSLKIQNRPELKTSPWLTTYMIGFSFKANSPMKNLNYRKALSLVAHQEEIPQLLRSGEEAAKSWIPPALIPNEYRETKSLFDPEQAKIHFQQIPRSLFRKDPELYFNGGERHKMLMERFAYNAFQTLGVKIQLHPIEWKVLLSQLKFKAPDMYRYAWTAVYPDPLFFLELFHSKNINNFGGYKNKDFDALIEELQKVSLDKRDLDFWKKVSEAQDILVRKDPALIPIYHYQKNSLISKRVKGLGVSPRGLDALKNASF